LRDAIVTHVNLGIIRGVNVGDEAGKHSAVEALITLFNIT